MRLLAVSKGVPVRRLEAAIAAGIVELGESRVQEAEAKALVLPGARWELVGRLQANKAARASSLFEAIHAVDSVALAVRLDRALSGGPAATPAGRQLKVFLQVNIDHDPAKAGFSPAALEAALPELAGLAGLELAGLMTIGRLVPRADDARPSFAALRRLSASLVERVPVLGPGLSMGMSDDFEVAVEEGSTVVRVGRAIFGPAPAG